MRNTTPSGAICAFVEYASPDQASASAPFPLCPNPQRTPDLGGKWGGWGVGDLNVVTIAVSPMDPSSSRMGAYHPLGPLYPSDLWMSAAGPLCQWSPGY